MHSRFSASYYEARNAPYLVMTCKGRNREDETLQLVLEPFNLAAILESESNKNLRICGGPGPAQGRKAKLNALTSPESSVPETDDIFQRQSQASTSMAPADKPITKNSTVDYTLPSRTCDRYGVSDRVGAAITKVVLHTSTSEIIDQNKLRRKGKKERKLDAKEDNVLQIPAL
ncbi:hypothetical protein AVEN_22634-1 [Araneus ventricosus]|uniref:Uncharacterized protein n=1 Tax=Araneus ventricosus TaxID=182803 RepID=A0A4Y2JI38_ARAVE|nr:hypothetical protein AVEN_22634-1 [Araneus ventricosus]